MPLDPLLSLAVSVQAAPGTYAVLLGAGVSRAAEIPTGYDVILDLLRRLAAANDVQGEDDQIRAWFEQAHGAPPTYPLVLAAAAPTSAERRTLHEGYFEPSADDREAGRKMPTAAHRAIAELVRDGQVWLPGMLGWRGCWTASIYPASVKLSKPEQDMAPRCGGRYPTERIRHVFAVCAKIGACSASRFDHD